MADDEVEIIEIEDDESPSTYINRELGELDEEIASLRQIGIASEPSEEDSHRIRIGDYSDDEEAGVAKDKEDKLAENEAKEEQPKEELVEETEVKEEEINREPIIITPSTITVQMREKLEKLKFTDDEIDKMTPDEGLDYIRGNKQRPEVNEGEIETSPVIPPAEIKAEQEIPLQQEAVKEEEKTEELEELTKEIKPRKSGRRKKGTIVYKDDNDDWVVVEPPYTKKKRQKSAPAGVYKANTKAVQIIGGKPTKATPTVDLGFVRVKMTKEGELITEYRQGGETGRVIREVIPQPAKSFTSLGLRKTELPQYKTANLRVYLVNGDYVRRHYGIPFNGGGNDRTIPSAVPQNEIWIEQVPSVNKMKSNLLYQLIERRKLSQGKDVQTAYNEAKEEIKRLENDINELDRNINSEVASNPELNMAYQQTMDYSRPSLTREGGLRKKKNRRIREVPYILGGEYYLHHKVPQVSYTGEI